MRLSATRLRATGGAIARGGTAVDAAAAAYIAAVEAADGQSLEAGVKTAINAFVMGCKADGIWEAIKASCILSGARTLSGALVPLAGTGPTNNNFVSGDYDRKTGLVGNGSTKYLNSNRNNNADPQNSCHVSCYRTRSAGGNQAFVAARTNNDAIGARYLWMAGTAPQFGCNPSTDIFDTAGSDTLNVATFQGVNRASGTATTGRINGTNHSFVRNSGSPVNNNLRIFCGANGVDQELFSNSRLAFYSIGESLDLALLDARVTTLISTYAAAIP
jgi:hypothetical protein